jgi:hypothetical protein
MYDDYFQTFNVGNNELQWAGYVYDQWFDYKNAFAVSLPLDGSGIGTYGRYVYTEHTYWGVQTQNAPWIQYPTDSYVPTNILTYSLVNFTATTGTYTQSDIVEAIELLGGNPGIVFGDGSRLQSAGIPRVKKDTGNNYTTLDADMNGKFILLGSNTGGNSTYVVPENADVALPIGYTVTFVLDDFNGNYVYINTNGNTNNGLHIQATGFLQAFSNNNWWRFGSSGNSNIYTLMKVDTNRWILSGADVQDDS